MAGLFEKLLGAEEKDRMSHAEFVALSPQEREAYFREAASISPQALAGALMMVTDSNNPDQIRAALSGIDPALQQSAVSNMSGVKTAQQQAAADTDLSDVMHSRLGPIIGLGALGGAAYLGLGAGTAAEAAAGGATAAAPEALGSGLSLGATGASGITPGVAASGIGAGELGTGLSAGAAAPASAGAAGAAGSAGALGAGYFGGESLYPVTGGLSGSASAGGTALPAAAGGATGAAGAAAGGTALSRILAGNGTSDDYLSVAGALGPAALGAYGSYQQTQAYRDLADKYMGMGAPYRSRLEALYNDPSSYLSSSEVQVPVQQGTDALARSLSVQGNPIGSGTALQTLQNYSANQLYGRQGAEKDRLAGFGGLTQYNAAAPGASAAAVGSERGIYDAIGAGAADLFNPRPKPVTLSDIYRAYRGGAGSLA